MYKAGLDMLYNDVTIEFPGALQGSYTFTSMANLQRGVYQQYQQAFGEPSLSQSNPNLGLFVQGEWTVHPSVTLNAGLRYDLQWLPDPIQTDANNVSPRAGIAWASADRHTVVRAAGGVYFDRTPLRATSNALQRDGIHYRVAVLSFGQEGAPVFPTVLPAFPAGVVTAITTIDPELQNGRSEQFGLQAERAIGRTTSVAAAYTYQRGHNIIMSRNVNVPTLTAAQAAAQGIPNLGRPNPQFANISRFEAIGDSWVDGVTLSLNARPVSWGSARLAYTLSKADDTAGNAFFSTPQDNFDIAAEKGPSDNDQRHRFVMSGTIGGESLPWLHGVEMGYVASYATGVPFNIVAGSDLNNDTNNNDRPNGVSRNTGRQSSTGSVDLRVSRAFRISGRQSVEAIVETFNLFNQVNILAVNSTFGVAPCRWRHSVNRRWPAIRGRFSWDCDGISETVRARRVSCVTRRVRPFGRAGPGADNVACGSRQSQRARLDRERRSVRGDRLGCIQGSRWYGCLPCDESRRRPVALGTRACECGRWSGECEW
jgi:hypothetical protein